MDSIVLFLKEDILPEDKSEADKVRRKAPRFWLSENQKLYKRSFSSPYLLCVHPEAVELILEKLHEGICGSHRGEDPYHTRPLHKATGGRRYSKTHWITQRNVINVKGSP